VLSAAKHLWKLGIDKCSPCRTLSKFASVVLRRAVRMSLCKASLDSSAESQHKGLCNSAEFQGKVEVFPSRSETEVPNRNKTTVPMKRSFLHYDLTYTNELHKYDEHG